MSWFSKLFSFGRKVDENSVHQSIQSIIKEELNRTKAEISDNMRMYGRNASGRSVKGMKVRVSKTTGYIDAPVSWNWMEQGRAPGGESVGYLARIIRRWIIDKGISVKSKRHGKRNPIIGASYAIATNIINNGTKLHRSSTKQDIYTSAVKRAQQRIATKSAEYTVRSIREIFRFPEY